jgi:hypothetical protein
VWEHRSDGVTFDVSVTDGKLKTTMTQFLDPGSSLNDRAWVEMNLDLSNAQADPWTSLATSAGPRGDVGWDWALWGNPPDCLAALVRRLWTGHARLESRTKRRLIRQRAGVWP